MKSELSTNCTFYIPEMYPGRDAREGPSCILTIMGPDSREKYIHYLEQTNSFRFLSSEECILRMKKQCPYSNRKQ